MPLGSTSKPRLCWTNKVHVTKKITDRIPSILDEISVWRWFSRKKSIQNRFSQFESTHNSTKLLTSMRSDVFTRRSMLRDWIFHGTKVARRRLASYQPPKHQYQVDGWRSDLNDGVYFHIGIWHTTLLYDFCIDFDFPERLSGDFFSKMAATEQQVDLKTKYLLRVTFGSSMVGWTNFICS